MHRDRHILLMLLLLQACLRPPAANAAEAELACNSDVSRSHVVVTVQFFDGWTRPVLGALDGRGNLTIVGAYWDTTSIVAAIEPDSAVTMIDRLLALDFFGQPEVYDTTRFHVRACGQDSVIVTQESTLDGGAAIVELFLGRRHHRVELRYPAHGAPRALMDWVQEFRELLKRHANWALH